jgi:acyl-coenzyme A synthetase/AMP-(fatty) acid ligase
MFEATRLALRRTLTMANLFENLYEIYGDREVIRLAEPAARRLFQSPDLTCGDCLRFTNLAAEAFIRDLDLKKGERIVLCGLEPAEQFLVAVAAIKAGGVVVPIHSGLDGGEMRERVRGCGAELAVVGGEALARRPDLPECMPGVQRISVSGPPDESPQGTHSLQEAMSRSSGFFIPYTLKPSNVVGLFYKVMEDGSDKAVMVTNQGFLGRYRAPALLFPHRCGDIAVCAFPPESAYGFLAATLALAMGSRLYLMPDSVPELILEACVKHKPTTFMGASGAYSGLLEAGAAGYDLGSVRLWFAAGVDMPQKVIDAFRGLGSIRLGALRWPALFVQSFDAGGKATMLTLKPSPPFAGSPEGSTGPVVPPNRMRVVDGTGRRVMRGEEGELAIKGPAVTPGYWNDIMGTLAVKRDGWLHTGIKARRNRFSITLRT